jgi:DNA-directed RNA polymerase specialized sigma24 family protein
MVTLMTSFGTRRLDTGGRLTLEWARIRARPAHLVTANGWRLVDDPVVSLDEILTAVGYECDQTDATERRLRRLVEFARTDELAARVVVQRILPGLLATARRRRGMADDVFGELVGAAWIAVRTFNPARSPRSIAASLISDADYAAFRAQTRRQSSSELPVDARLVERPHVRESSSCELLAEILTEAADAGVPADDLDLLRQLMDTPTTNQLATMLQITPRTIRNRRARITARLREITVAA